MSALCPLATLVQALRGASAVALGQADAPLRELGQAMARVLLRLERPCVLAAQQEERLRDTLLALLERLEQLQVRLRADAGLRHAEPQRALAATQALAALQRLDPSGATASGVSETEDGDPAALRVLPALSSELSLRLLSTAQALLVALAEPPLRGLRPLLDLEEIVTAITGLREQAAALAARWVAAREALQAQDDQPELSHEEAAAVALLLHHRAYALAATGPLHPQAEQPLLRAQLLAPLQHLPLPELARALGRYETQHPRP